MYRDDTRNRLDFDSLTEMAAWLADLNPRQSREHSQKFYGHTTWQQALGYAAFGNDESVPEAQKLLSQLEAELPVSTMTFDSSVAGCFPVVAEYLNGEPECMREPVAIQSETAPLAIYVDLTCSAGIKPEQMRRRGIAVLALTMALSAARPISLHICTAVGADEHGENMDGERYAIATCRIETSPLDLTRTAWALSDVACGRRLFYGASEIYGYNGGWPKLKGVEYGNATSPEYMNRMCQLLNVDGDTLYIPAVSMYSGEFEQMVEQPIEWINAKLDQLTGRETA